MGQGGIYDSPLAVISCDPSGSSKLESLSNCSGWQPAPSQGRGTLRWSPGVLENSWRLTEDPLEGFVQDPWEERKQRRLCRS